MKKAFILLIVLTVSASLYAQESLFNKGNVVVNGSIGLGSVLYSGSGYTSAVPPVAVSAEWGLKEGVLEKGVIGVGGYLGYSSYKWEYLGWGWKYSNTIIGVRGTFHYPLIDKLDTYTGLLVGYNIVTAKEFGSTILGDTYKANSSSPIWAWYAGGRYYFNEKIAAMAEIGYGIAWLNLGLAYKIK